MSHRSYSTCEQCKAELTPKTRPESCAAASRLFLHRRYLSPRPKNKVSRQVADTQAYIRTSTIILLFLTSARQSARSCFSPELKLPPAKKSSASVSNRGLEQRTFVSHSGIKTELGFDSRIYRPLLRKKPCALQSRDKLCIGSYTRWITADTGASD